MFLSLGSVAAVPTHNTKPTEGLTMWEHLLTWAGNLLVRHAHACLGQTFWNLPGVPRVSPNFPEVLWRLPRTFSHCGFTLSVQKMQSRKNRCVSNRKVRNYKFAEIAENHQKIRTKKIASDFELRVTQEEVGKRSSARSRLFIFGHFLVTFSDASVTFSVDFFPKLLLPDSCRSRGEIFWGNADLPLPHSLAPSETMVNPLPSTVNTVRKGFLCLERPFLDLVLQLSRKKNYVGPFLHSLPGRGT